MTTLTFLLILYSMEKQALFIHGLHSDSESTTGGFVAEILRQYGFETIHPTFDLMDCKATMEQIKKIIIGEKVSLVAAHSLGGFYGFAIPFDSVKILINPCLKPEIEIPKLLYPEQGEVFPENLKKEWPGLREEAIKNSAAEKSKTYGIFAKNDDLFSYAEYAGNELKFAQVTMIEGGHKPEKEQLASGLKEVLQSSR